MNTLNNTDAAKAGLLSSLPWLAYCISFVVIILDQITKQWVSAVFEYGQVDSITSFFNLTLRHNYGVAFSLFDKADGQQRWFLAALAIVVSIVLVVWIARLGMSLSKHLDKKWTLEIVGLALILGGAIGNVYDRVLLGYVVDFIEVHYAGHYWPAFNIADSAICVGAGLLIYDAFFFAKKREQAIAEEQDKPSKNVP